jgi:hypothetical protein
MSRRNARRRSRKNGPASSVGLAWYDPSQWAKLKAVAADKDQMDETHDAWRRNAERTMKHLTAQGCVVRRVPIDVDALVQWCQANNKPVDGKSRAEYVSLIVSGNISP